MKRFVSSLLTLGMLLTPSFSLAEFTRPSELFTLMSGANLPVGFSGELHGNVDTYWLSAWISGSAKGTRAADALANIKGTVDVAMDGGKVRVKFQMRVVDGNAYFYIDSIDGSYEDPMWSAAANIRTKTWIKIELPEDFSFHPDESDLAMLDQMLSLTSSVTDNGTHYELSLTRESVRDMLKHMRDMEYQEWDEALSAVPRTAKFGMTVSTNKAHAFTQAAGSVEMASKKMTFNAKGSAWALSSLTVTAPAESLSLEEWAASAMNAFSSGLTSPFTNEYEETEWEHSDWEEPSDDLWEEDQWEDMNDNAFPEDDCRLDMDAVRHSNCETFERTPRRLP